MTRRTKKFSQFVGPVQVTDTDIVVGLRNGRNYQFTGVGSGSGGGGDAVVIPVNQPGHNLSEGQWVRINAISDFVPAIATSAQDAEVVGVVSAVQDANNFSLQMLGELDVSGFPGYGALNPGTVYFLSDTVVGAIDVDEPTIDGYVSKPCFVAKTEDIGYVMQYRGIVNGGQPPIQSGGSSTDPLIAEITQPGHTFVAGDFVYVSADDTYDYADATAFLSSNSIGVVTATNGDDFTLQQAGRITGVVTQDDVAAPIDSGVPYYISETVPGKVTKVIPTGAGQYTKPVYIQQTLVGNIGWVLDQRSLAVDSGGGGGGGAVAETITQAGHGFNVGDWVLYSGAPTNAYELAANTNATTAESIGLVVNVPDVNTFVLQMAGFTDVLLGAGLTPGGTYFLSSVPGEMTLIEPTAPGSVSKPVFIATGLEKGCIMPYRGEVLGNGTPGSDPIIGIINQPGHTFLPGDWVYVSGDNTFALADASAFLSSNAIGVVIEVDGDNFSVQQSGQLSGIVMQDYAGNPLIVGNVYYISTTPGGITNVAPSGATDYTRPAYIPQASGTATGWILDQRSLPVSGGAGPAAGSVVGVYTFEYTSFLSLSGVSAPTFVDLGPMSITFTPAYSNSKFVIHAKVSIYNANQFALRLVRAPSTNISVGTSVGFPAGGTTDIANGSNYATDINTIIGIDIPLSGAAITYKLQYSNPNVGGALNLNGGYQSPGPAYINSSQIIVYEVKQ